MSLGGILFKLFIGPILLIFETLFSFANRHVGNPGFAIILLSLVVNILVFPLYRRADVIQKRERELEKKLKPELDFLNKHFKGDERFMVVQTFYRQNNYSPLHTLNGAIPLLLQIPFFMAAYKMLSSLKLLEGVSFGPIRDLGAADGMIAIGALSINVLPILMTLINIISGIIYTKGAPLKEKVQLFLMAGLFLVLLYKSPSGLAFYWMLNNLFSLLKNVIMALVERFTKNNTAKKSKKSIIDSLKESTKENDFLFAISGILLAVMTGFFIPSQIVASSPLEFLDPYLYDNSIKYVWFALAVSAGTYVVWASIIYYLSSSKVRTLFSMIYPAIAIYTVASFFVNKNSLVAVNSNMSINYGFEFYYSGMEYMTDALMLVLFIMLIVIIVRNKKMIVSTISLILAMALLISSVINVVKINRIYDGFNKPSDAMLDIKLSKEGQNVIVIMLDRDVGLLFNTALKIHPELKERLDGFTFYPYTVSYGMTTNVATPALFGGYEYTPYNINRRPDESLESKHNEALSVLPVLFSQNNYDVTAINLPYLGYQAITDTSVLDSYDGVNCYYTGVSFTAPELVNTALKSRERNLFLLSESASVPLFLRNFVYDSGRYHMPDPTGYVNQVFEDEKTANGIPFYTTLQYDMLRSLGASTSVCDNSGSFVVMQNSLPHEPAIFDTEDWSISSDVHNETDAFTEVSHGLDYLMSYYHSNYVSMVLLADWFDYLKEIGVYDNTRIIITADHGYEMSSRESNRAIEAFSTIMLVKDFGASGFNISEEVMTNADTAFLAVNGVISNPINPFTGNVISNDDKFNGPLVVSRFIDHDILRANGNTFISNDGWYSISGDDIFNYENWTFMESYD